MKDSMKKNLIIGCVFLLASFLAGLYFLFRESDYTISRETITEEIYKAENGSLESIQRAAIYYSFIEVDELKSLKWLTKGSEMGDAWSQHNLSGFYLYNTKYKDVKKARYWAEKSLGGGVTQSRSLILEIQQHEKLETTNERR